MIIQVDNGSRQSVAGVAEAAAISVKGDTATVAVEIGALIALPRPTQELTLFGDQRWQVIRTISRTPQVVTFTCRRLADG